MITRETGRGQRLEVLIEPDTQAGQNAKCCIMGYQTFCIPSAGTDEGKQAHTDGRKKKVEHHGTCRRKARKRFMPTDKEMAGLRQRLTRGVGQMETALSQVSQAAAQLKPASEAGREQLQQAYDRWQESLHELDQAYATGWAGLSREVVGVWQDAFLPKLTRLGGERRRFLPRSLKVAFYFILVLAVAALAYLFFTGQLSNVIRFE